MTLKEETKRHHDRLVLGWYCIGVGTGILLAMLLLLLAYL